MTVRVRGLSWVLPVLAQNSEDGQSDHSPTTLLSLSPIKGAVLSSLHAERL